MKSKNVNNLPFDARSVSPKEAKLRAAEGNPIGDIVAPGQNPHVHHLFSTPIWYTKCVDNLDKIHEEIEEVIPEIDFKMIPSWGSTHYLSTQTFQQDLFQDFMLDSLLNEIRKNLAGYMKEARFENRPFKMCSWLTKFEKRCYGHIHNHGTSDISGVYYHKTNGKDGDLFFQSPAPGHGMSKVFGLSCSGSRRYIPKEGVLILFPGFLDHGINTNETDNTRISLSFNIRFAD